MKKFVNFSKALLLAMCVTFTLSFFTGCEKESDARDGYVGNWQVHQTFVLDGTVWSSDYNITISKSSVSKSDIIISNIINAGQGVQVIAIVTGDTFIIPQQTIEAEGLSGSGRRTGNTLNFSVLISFELVGQVNATLAATRM